ncbi:MAG: hypothetical protein LBB41_05895 [Prevotellaceae bacterium]|jgi:hypothetical protein|nr:hypothetical protein [Prevotellaceae bacterium]
MNIKLDKTEALAKIYNEITKELKEKTFNFKTDVDTFNAAINDFITELDCNVLNCNKDLIISRLDKNFPENFPYFDLNDFDDKTAELLSVYRDFSDLLFDMSYDGLQECKELAEREQKKNVAKPQQTSHKSTETITGIISQALQYDLIQPTPKRAENDNGLYDFQIAVLESLHGVNFVCWLQENKKDKDIAKNYTFSNFCQYLKSHYQTVEAQKAAFEKEFESKKQYWQSVVFNNSEPKIIPTETLQALENEKLISQSLDFR